MRMRNLHHDERIQLGERGGGGHVRSAFGQTFEMAWNPADAPGPAPQQWIPPRSPVAPDGSTLRGSGALWAPSGGPCRAEPGGAGGEPDGRTISIRKECWD